MDEEIHSERLSQEFPRHNWLQNKYSNLPLNHKCHSGEPDVYFKLERNDQDLNVKNNSDYIENLTVERKSKKFSQKNNDHETCFATEPLDLCRKSRGNTKEQIMNKVQQYREMEKISLNTIADNKMQEKEHPLIFKGDCIRNMDTTGESSFYSAPKTKIVGLEGYDGIQSRTFFMDEKIDKCRIAKNVSAKVSDEILISTGKKEPECEKSIFYEKSAEYMMHVQEWKYLNEMEENIIRKRNEILHLKKKKYAVLKELGDMSSHISKHNTTENQHDPHLAYIVPPHVCVENLSQWGKEVASIPKYYLNPYCHTKHHSTIQSPTYMRILQSELQSDPLHAPNQVLQLCNIRRQIPNPGRYQDLHSKVLPHKHTFKAYKNNNTPQLPAYVSSSEYKVPTGNRNISKMALEAYIIAHDEKNKILNASTSIPKCASEHFQKQFIRGEQRIHSENCVYTKNNKPCKRKREGIKDINEIPVKQNSQCTTHVRSSLLKSEPSNTYRDSTDLPPSKHVSDTFLTGTHQQAQHFPNQYINRDSSNHQQIPNRSQHRLSMVALQRNHPSALIHLEHSKVSKEEPMTYTHLNTQSMLKTEVPKTLRIVKKNQVTSRCIVCGNSAVYICSLCRKIWYCTRKCQLFHWPLHQQNCKTTFPMKDVNLDKW